MNKISKKKKDFEALCSANGVKITPEFMVFLEKYDFFALPASVEHHGNIGGGLVDHCITVAETLLILTRNNHLDWKNPRSPVLIGLFHDLCKLESYKLNQIGGWMHTEARDHLYTGHGDKSVLMLAPFFQLTDEEVACIRWHMGAFDEQTQWSHYTAAVRKFPNVLWTHQADMIAAHIRQK